MAENEKSRKERAIRVGLEAVSLVAETAEDVGVNVAETVSSIKNKALGERRTRDNAVMVRVDQDSLARIDELVDAEVAGSRSEAAAYLIAEGIKARQGFFSAIADKVAEIKKVKEELRQLMRDDLNPQG